LVAVGVFLFPAGTSQKMNASRRFGVTRIWACKTRALALSAHEEGVSCGGRADLGDFDLGVSRFGQFLIVDDKVQGLAELGRHAVLSPGLLGTGLWLRGLEPGH
jgi:hypothetical protein